MRTVRSSACVWLGSEDGLVGFLAYRCVETISGRNRPYVCLDMCQLLALIECLGRDVP